MYKIADTVRIEVNKACKALKIKPCRVKFNNNNELGFAININNWHRYITISNYTLIKDSKINNTLYLFKLFKMQSISRRIKFIIYHEVAHYLQFVKYKKWYIKELDKDNKAGIRWFSPVEYRQIKAEKIADRIAMYLLNKGL